ncbi:hypothetical protein F503_00414 [Ophiostoma piceae UAMH 11346]|uniref:Uncharacterized protein n=1 Tax=Ophiostoma piceae (strain UAMH 11346) TaxID=1262450 RepID=S3C4I4_OPHP1|nr:hypothetical protein F503_00414 [Ophiostoma piceae UAMH 11346]
MLLVRYPCSSPFSVSLSLPLSLSLSSCPLVVSSSCPLHLTPPSHDFFLSSPSPGRSSCPSRPSPPLYLSSNHFRYCLTSHLVYFLFFLFCSSPFPCPLPCPPTQLLSPPLVQLSLFSFTSHPVISSALSTHLFSHITAAQTTRMGLSETASQCLCPLDQGGNTSSGTDTENSQRDSLSASVLDHQRPSISRHHRKKNPSSPPSLLHSPSPPLPTPPPLRRSPTFYDGGNAQQCIEACRRGFLSALTLTTTPSPLPLPSASSTGIVNSDDGVSLPAACSALSGPEVQQELWQLYWCDSAFCGVWIAADGGIGQDPNVDLFINECQNLGGRSHQRQGSIGGGGVIDGGSRVGSGGEMGTVNDAHAHADEFDGLGEYGGSGGRGGHYSIDPVGSPSTISLKIRLRQSQMLFLPGHFRGAASRNHRRPRESGGEVPTPLISPANSCSSVPGVINSGGPTSLQKFQLDRREDAQRSGRSLWSFVLSPSLFSRRNRQDRSISPPLTSLSPPPSPTQLSARGSGTEQAGSGSITGNHTGFYGYNSSPVPYYFPSSPICAPTTNKLEPRRERTPTIKTNKSAASLSKAAAKSKPPQALGYYNFQGSHAPPVPPVPQPGNGSSYSQPDRHSAAESAGTVGSARGLRSSYGSYSTVTNASIPTSSLYGNALTSNMMEPMTPVPGLPAPPTPASPARPPRPHESPLEIPDLVMPDPPPLPPPPRGTLASANRSFSMPASAFSFSSLGGRKTLSGSHPVPPPPRMPPAMTLSVPPPLPAPHDIVYANSLDSFSSHPAAIANANANAAMASKAGLSRMNPKDPILPAGPPPNRALPPPPPPPPVPPMSSKRLSGTASLASMARSLSLSPRPPQPESVPEDVESIASFELPPLLMRDDPDDGQWEGKTAQPHPKPKMSPKDGSAPPKAQTSSFSSTISASSMLSSSTADTMASMTTSSTMTTSSMTATAAPVSDEPQSTLTPASGPSAATSPFYNSLSMASSSITIKPEKIDDSPNVLPSIHPSSQ